MTLIPTDNADEALQFCRALQNTLQQSKLEYPPPRSPVVLSIVIPVYNEEENVTHIHERLSNVIPSIVETFEIIFVDDGSSEKTKEILLARANLDPRVFVVELTRNFGQQAAFSAGLSIATGQATVIMDCDLQDSPEAIATFVEKWRAGYDVVYAVRAEREGSKLKRSAYFLFYRFYRLIAGIKVPVDAGDFCLLDRKVVQILLLLEEKNRFLRGLRSWVGLKQIAVSLKRPERMSGQSKYDLGRLMNLALDGIVSFSFAPLRFISLVGVAVSILSVLLAIFYGIKKALYGLTPPGFATIVVLVCFFAGVQLLTVGVIGEYVGRIFLEVKRRPQFLIGRIIGRRNSDQE